MGPFEKSFGAVVALTDAVEIDSEVVAHVVKLGYAEQELGNMRVAWLFFSLNRKFLVSPVFPATTMTMRTSAVNARGP